ncbi:MAG: hypothetical protein ABFC24_00655 [Methanoregulaceae archaeon]
MHPGSGRAEVPGDHPGTGRDLFSPVIAFVLVIPVLFPIAETIALRMGGAEIRVKLR